MDFGKKTRKMVMVYILLLMEIPMKVHGKIIKCTDYLRLQNQIKIKALNKNNNSSKEKFVKSYND